MDAMLYANERKRGALVKLHEEIRIKRSDIIGRFQGFGVIWEELAEIKHLNLYEIQQREKIEQAYQSDILNFESRIKVEKEKAEKKKKAELEKKAILTLDYLSIEHNRMSEKLKYLETIQKQLAELQSTTPPAYIPSNNPTE